MILLQYDNVFDFCDTTDSFSCVIFMQRFLEGHHSSVFVAARSTGNKFSELASGIGWSRLQFTISASQFLTPTRIYIKACRTGYSNISLVC